ncbi:glycosyltransferase family 4 protein [uncultured Tateyamaria sp.]|uniref:glycosyltransferase family 4 protein n=1 Tax=uncultured Tateyamaria sp. TaxID=455651 RepID=UPI0026344742|nr:glycosyltransferase family 4 protein [uncultured Tateyamaria sp.]
MSKRHILLANVFFAPFTYGGATIVAEELAKALIARGDYRVTAVSLCTRSELKTYTVMKSERDGIVNYVINVPEHRGYHEMYNNPQVTAVLGELMDGLKPDLVHAHCIQDMGTGVLEAARARDIPSILSIHDFWWICERQFMIRPDGTYCGQSPVRIDACRGCASDMGAARTRFGHLQMMGTLADRVTYPSQFAHDLITASGFAPSRGVVLENGARLPDAGFAAKQAARRANDPTLTFGFVGGPSHIKGWPLIKSAFQKLDRDDFRMLLVDGSPDGTWWDPSDMRGLNGDWQIYPRFDQADMDSFYAQIDVLLFMSQWKETFGLAIREALARGITVIQTDSGGTVEHAAATTTDLIPIGAPASALRDQIAATLDHHPSHQKPMPVTDYTDQAEAFHCIAEDVLAART